MKTEIKIRFNDKNILKELYFAKELHFELESEEEKAQFIEDLTASLDMYNINVCDITLYEHKPHITLTSENILPKTRFNKIKRDFKKYGYEIV